MPAPLPCWLTAVRSLAAAGSVAGLARRCTRSPAGIRLLASARLLLRRQLALALACLLPAAPICLLMHWLACIEVRENERRAFVRQDRNRYTAYPRIPDPVGTDTGEIVPTGTNVYITLNPMIFSNGFKNLISELTNSQLL